MTTTPTDIANLAMQINADVNYSTNAADRAVIGRAYYSAYHVGQQIITKYRLPFASSPVRGSHMKELTRLTECKPSSTPDYITVQSIGYMASRTLNPHRVHADYLINDPLPPSMKPEALARVQKILENAKKIL
ncbi:MAG TPA: hypothetical protein VK974_07160 [Methylophilaceae bacterium]|nr:hypothetical protein [Methylophilaceae bacterium]